MGRGHVDVMRIGYAGGAPADVDDGRSTRYACLHVLRRTYRALDRARERNELNRELSYMYRHAPRSYAHQTSPARQHAEDAVQMPSKLDKTACSPLSASPYRMTGGSEDPRNGLQNIFERERQSGM